MSAARTAIVGDPPIAASGVQPSALAHDAESTLWTTLAALAAAEAVLAFAHLFIGLGLVPVALLHFLVVGIAAHRLLTEQHAGTDVTARALMVFAIAAAGPIGALAGGLFARASMQPPIPSPLLDEWYRRIALSSEIDPVTELCDNVASGRTMNLASPIPQSFLSVMVSGAIADQQTALGLIARRFHPDYLPALARALRSPEPVIRVQAAAVVARIRDELQQRVRANIAAFEDPARPENAATLLNELEKAIESGLLDETDRLLAEPIVAREGAGPENAAAGRQRGYKALRVTRRRRRIARKGAYRVRSLRRRTLTVTNAE